MELSNEQKRDFAAEYDLTYIETTDQPNGYPSNIKGALIGLDNYDIAQRMQFITGGRLEIFTRKEGQQLWYRTGNRAFSELELTPEHFGPDVMEHIGGPEDFKNVVLKEIQEQDFKSMDQLREWLEAKEELMEAYEHCNPATEMVLMRDGNYISTEPRKTMHYRYDSKHTVIGII